MRAIRIKYPALTCGVPLARFQLDLVTGDRKSSVSTIKRSNRHLFILEASLTCLANFRYSRPREWSLLVLLFYADESWIAPTWIVTRFRSRRVLCFLVITSRHVCTPDGKQSQFQEILLHNVISLVTLLIHRRFFPDLSIIQSQSKSSFESILQSAIHRIRHFYIFIQLK